MADASTVELAHANYFRSTDNLVPASAGVTSAVISAVQECQHNGEVIEVSNRYSLTLRVDFTAGDDPAACTVVTQNLDALQCVADDIRGLTPSQGNEAVHVKLKLQRLNDGAPPRALVVETL